MDQAGRGIEIWLPLTWGEFTVLCGSVLVFGLSLCLWAVLVNMSNEDRDHTGNLRNLFGLGPMSKALFGWGAFLWIVVLSALVVGLLASIVELVGIGTGLIRDESAQLRYIFAAFVAMTATLGAVIALPFTLIKRLHAERQTTATEEGLVTDRINAAVASLGAEKVVKEVSEHARFRKDAAGNLERDEGGKPVSETDDDGVPIIDREVREITRPNLEVRIGAILALERIAREKLAFHVQIMQILCAYVRTNAPANQADRMPKLDMGTRGEGGALAFDWKERRHLFNVSLSTALSKVSPREDIVVAMQVIGRRTHEQRAEEAQWGTNTARAGFSFDARCPVPPGQEMTTAVDWLDYRRRLEEWREWHLQTPGYTLDLRNTDLRKHDLSAHDLAAARLNDARLQGAILSGARLQGSILSSTHLQGAVLREAQLQGADLEMALLQGADLSRAQLQGTSLSRVQLQGAILQDGQLQGTTLWRLNFEGADLSGAEFQGARLQRGQFDGAVSLRAANFSGAALGYSEGQVNLSMLEITQEQINGAFGDASVELPKGIFPPPHWAATILSASAFDAAYDAWLATLPPE